jgi:AP-1-like transcription factor
VRTNPLSFERFIPSVIMSTFPPLTSFSLSQDQEDLLMAALGTPQQPQSATALTPPSRDVFNFSNGSLESSLFTGPSPQTAMMENTDFAAMTDQQFMDFLDGNGDDDAQFEDSPENDMDDSLMDNDSRDLHDKRKSYVGGDYDDDESAPKRREGEEKQAKKPGRKPLTNEPTSVSSCLSLQFHV